jgi:SAM-dependent methyltransferase
MVKKEFHEMNRLSWNKATEAHNSHRGDQAAFFRAGGNTLFSEETELLGDIRGLSLLHLQCNGGQDTLSLAQLGAEVTGVDISDTAIDFARRLAADSGVPASFHRADIFDWLTTDEQQYDVVFTSYGALVWLSDLEAWGKGITRVLKPGGRFVLMEFHPMFGVFEEGWRLTYSYMGGTHIEFGGVGDYVADTADSPFGFEAGMTDYRNPHPSHEFCWGIADIVTPLLNAGLRLCVLREYPYSNGSKRFPDMRRLPGRRYGMPEGMPSIAMMLGIVAEKDLA